MALFAWNRNSSLQPERSTSNFWINIYSGDGNKLCGDLRKTRAEKKEKSVTSAIFYGYGCADYDINSGHLSSAYSEICGDPEADRRQHFHPQHLLYTLFSVFTVWVHLVPGEQEELTGKRTARARISR